MNARFTVVQLSRILSLGISSALALGLVACRDEAPGDNDNADAAPDPVCGDGVASGDEACDGEDLRGESCVSLGLGATGTLGCTADCRFDGAACAPGDCGDGYCEVAVGEGHQSCPQDCAWVRLAAGYRQTCGVRVDGSLWCWGKNHAGQLGGDAGLDSAEPRRVDGLLDVTDVSTGEGHTCALEGDGGLWCWGTNARGQLGTGGASPSASPPVPVSSLSDVAAVAAGNAHTCAVDSLGALFCWGANDDGQLGNGGFDDALVPTVVDTLDDVATVTAGGDGDCSFSCATTGEALGYCWGCNRDSVLGRGDADAPAQDPAPGAVIAEDSDCDALLGIVAGGGHTCGLAPGHGLCCWGSNRSGETGHADPAEVQHFARAVLSGAGESDVWAALGLGGGHTCGFDTSDALLCWGANYFGQLGTGNTTGLSTPTPIGPLGQAVAGGVEHTCAIYADGTAWCWGQNFFGQLGDGTTEDRPTPAPVVH